VTGQLSGDAAGSSSASADGVGAANSVFSVTRTPATAYNLVSNWAACRELPPLRKKLSLSDRSRRWKLCQRLEVELSVGGGR
jgi:hypothetical protein